MERSKGPRETVGELEKFRGLGYLQGTRQQLFTNQFRNVDQVIDITGAADKFPGCTVKSDKQYLMRGKY